MAFRNFGSVEAVLREYPLVHREEPVLAEDRVDLPGDLGDRLRFALRRRRPGDTESYFAENFVWPLVQAVWMRHPGVHVWSHRTLTADDRLTGDPDYLIAANPTGVIDRFVTRPLAAVAEAKRQDFDEGWGQCLAAMLACQRVNGDGGPPVYGVVSTGLIWEFGRLDGDTFTRQPAAYAIHDPALVHGLLEGLFAECERNLAAGGGAAGVSG